MSRQSRYLCVCTVPCRQSVARWQDTLKGVPGLKAVDSLQPEKSPVSEELNLAWARHEIISDHVDEVRLSHASESLQFAERLGLACVWHRLIFKVTDVIRHFCKGQGHVNVLISCSFGLLLSALEASAMTWLWPMPDSSALQVLEWLDARRRDGSAKLLPQVKPRRRRRLLGRGGGDEAML